MSSRTLPTALLLASLPACALPPAPQDPQDSSDTEGPPPQTTGEADGSECTQLRASVEGLLRDKCGACHDAQTKGGLGGVSNLDGLIDGGYVVRGDSTESPLYQRVENGSMPLDSAPLSESELGMLADWIDTCTPVDGDNADLSLTERPACLENAPVSPLEVLQAIRSDIAALDPVRASTTRYFVLSHLHSAGYCEQQIEGYRHALAKLMNHLSQDPEIHIPEAIDPARTIFRIDLVDYGWDTQTWANITSADPYAVTLREQEAEVIQDLAATELFSVKGDWFIEAASQPPLYHTILELPTDRFALEASLGVNVDAGIADEITVDGDRVLRAGFQDSKVSDFNRVIERHQLPSAPQRAYWLSYDFASNNLEKSILDNPLDFVEDGGEIIFTLPNGLQGYMLVDAVGERIDRGPINIVHDSEVIEEPEVINGLSCMSCHSEGMRLATDEVRAYVEARSTQFPVEEREQVFKLYAPADEFARAQQRDVETFANSLALTGAPRRVGSHEPIMAAHLAFEQPIDLRRAAAEFGISETALLKRTGELQGISKLGDATVDRETFEANFAANACKLNLGETVDCPATPPSPL